MRGKYAAKAATRQDRSELERERDEALLAARRAEKALADERAAFEVKRAAFEREAVALREAAEKVVAPALADERIRSMQYRVERDESIEKLNALHEKQGKMVTRVAALLAGQLGITAFQAAELILSLIEGSSKYVVHDGRLLDRVSRGEITDAQARIIDQGQHGTKRDLGALVREVLGEAESGSELIGQDDVILSGRGSV